MSVSCRASDAGVFVFDAAFKLKATGDYTKRKPIWPRGYKTFFVLNSIGHENLHAHKYKNIKKFGVFYVQISLECYFSRS